MLEINDESLVGYPPVSGDLSKNSFLISLFFTNTNGLYSGF